MTQPIPNLDLLFPLSRFYFNEGLPLPNVAVIPSLQLPQPYRGLLDHDQDMTPTLEFFFRETMAISIIHSGRTGSAYTREVVLFTEQTRKPVAYGSIDIHLENVSGAARTDILSGHLPFGSILQKHAIQHVSEPSAFFEIDSDVATQKHFGLSRSTRLYGRRNRLSTPDGRTLADVLEILAPIDSAEKYTEKPKG
ncbi:MAG TPA: hypothetical protein VKX17_14030 [Planctomycetota bacterium]|nr:hypothetical protein [Planctomycetota bacterium]